MIDAPSIMWRRAEIEWSRATITQCIGDAIHRLVEPVCSYVT